MKRQRWLARQRSGEGVNSGHAQLGRGQSPPRERSPLSRLMAEGYPTNSSDMSNAQQPYGDRPPSDPLFLGKPSSQGSRGSSRPSRTSSTGFDSRVAGQWSADVQHSMQSRQNRHDPGVRGPPVHCGGQRVTQAPGGMAAIDLSWNAVHGQQMERQAERPGERHPPRMPMTGGQPDFAAGAATPTYADRGHQRPSPSGARSNSGAPFGRDSDQRDLPLPPARREACPFGMEPMAGGAAGRNSSQGPRRASPSPMARMSADVAAAGAGAVRGRGCRPPGGVSSVVFG